jgi:molybdopterin/thiamine biosynthesis adenylyltransferase
MKSYKKTYKVLTDSELEAYSRQVVLEDIGYDGQLKIRNAKVCLVGIGGLGTPTTLKLTGMGVGTLRIVDRDIVSRSDLHRQYLYDIEAIGKPKVEVALAKLNRLNPDVSIEALPESLNSLNAEDVIDGMDIVIDGLDRPEPRYLVNRTCNKLNIPYVFGAAIGALGQVSTLLPGKTFCLECFMPGLKDEDLPACGTAGVHPAVLGIVSSIQVAETVMILSGKSPLLFNRLLYINLKELEFNQLEMSAAESCRVCGTSPLGPPEKIVDRFFEETCARDGRRNFVVSPKARIDLDIAQLEIVIKENNLSTRFKSPFGVTFEKPGEMTGCILKSGVMIAQTPPRMDDTFKKQVLDTYTAISIKGLRFPSHII